MRQGVEGLQHQPPWAYAQLTDRAIAQPHVECDADLGRHPQHLRHRRRYRPAAGNHKNVLILVPMAHLLKQPMHTCRKRLPGRHALRADGAPHPLRQGVAQQPEMRPITRGRIGLFQRPGVDGLDQRLAVVFVESRHCDGRGKAGQCFTDARQRLRVALERAGEYRIKTLAMRAPVRTQAPRLREAARAQFVVIGGAKRGLPVAHKVERSHGGRLS